MSAGLDARRAALHAVRAVEERDAYSTLAVPAAVEDLSERRDRAFATNLAYETMRWQGTVDWALRNVVDRELTDIEPDLLRILRIGATQLMRTKVPDRAAVDTSVQLAHETVPPGRSRGAGGFVNGVLRGLARRIEDLPWPEEPVAALALRTAHPSWMVSELVARLGEDEAERALEADNAPPGLTLRATVDRGALLAELREEGHDAHPGQHAPEAVRVPGVDPRTLRAVAEGRATPQDEASMLVTHAVRAQVGETILDACAGPGGKSTHLAGLGARVVASELHAHRALLVVASATRLAVEVGTVVADVARPPFAAGCFDAVLVDAPCTGLGTGRRRPEVRWRRTEADTAVLGDVQGALLDAAVALVRPGGRVVYSACTWTRRETEEVADSLTARHRGVAETSRRQLWPHRDGTDGMFIATFSVASTPD